MTRIKNAVARFHGDDAGNESIQTVAILAVGAMVLVGLHAIWNSNIKDNVVTKIGDVFALDFK